MPNKRCPEPLNRPDPVPHNFWDALDVWERGYWEGLKARCNDSITAMSRQAGVSRSMIYERLGRLGLMPERKGRGGNAAWRSLSG